MKRLFLNGFLALALVWARLASAADLLYENDGQINSPPDIAPQVDATNFLNDGLINIALNSFVVTNSTIFSAIVLNTSILPFDFSDVQNYTNRGQMLCDTGFRFDTAPSGKWTASSHGRKLHVNTNGGQIIGRFVHQQLYEPFCFLYGHWPDLWQRRSANTGICHQPLQYRPFGRRLRWIHQFNRSNCEPEPGYGPRGRLRRL